MGKAKILIASIFFTGLLLCRSKGELKIYSIPNSDYIDSSTDANKILYNKVGILLFQEALKAEIDFYFS
jgi:hypothetical protein